MNFFLCIFSKKILVHSKKLDKFLKNKRTVLIYPVLFSLTGLFSPKITAYPKSYFFSIKMVVIYFAQISKTLLKPFEKKLLIN